MKNFRPLYDRILVRKFVAPEKTESGLLIPEVARENYHLKKVNYGEVAYVGHEVSDINPGDKIIWDKHSGTEVNVNDEKLWFIYQEDVFGILED